MRDLDPPTTAQLTALASHLAGRREAILEAWTTAVAADPDLAIAASLSIHHFRDLMPDVLRYFEARLRRTAGERRRLESEEEQRIVDHGLHRWQQGYHLSEVVREWNHLQIAVQEELERYALAHPELRPAVMATARRLWTETCGEGVTRSVTQHSALQQAEAEGRLRDLEAVLADVRDVERQRAESWHEAAHDLRGNVGLVTSSASLLGEEMPERLRAKALGTLQTSVSSLQHILEEMLSLARLEAGREKRKLQDFDAAALLRGLGESLRALADQRGLALTVEGPTPLPVEGDPGKVQRVVQNLTLNALRYTERGGVRLLWGESHERDVPRWLIRVEDTGPGFAAGPAAPLARELAEATDRAREIEERAADPDAEEPVPAPSGQGPSAQLQRPGEGIGLSIVKRLCELLEASLDVGSGPAGGTVVQVVLPRRYGAGGAPRSGA